MGPMPGAFEGDRIEGIGWMAGDPPTRLSRACNVVVLFLMAKRVHWIRSLVTS